MEKVFRILSIISHFIAIVCYFGAGLVFLLTMLKADSAPKEAAGSAMALCIAIIPYCFSRSLDSLQKKFSNQH